MGLTRLWEVHMGRGLVPQVKSEQEAIRSERRVLDRHDAN
jgi:hypothetical protein